MADIFTRILETTLFFPFAVMVQCLLVSLYCLLLYLLVLVFKKVFSAKLSVRANYYFWYLLLLSIPLAGLTWNEDLKVMLYGQYNMGRHWQLMNIATLVWLVNSLCKLMFHAVTCFKMNRSIFRMKTFADEDGLKWQAGRALAFKGKTIEKISIVVTNSVRSPVSYGLFHKTILLPQNYGNRYSKQELYLLLLHEMAHLKNHDTAKLRLIAFSQSFIWVLGFLDRQFKQDTEILCDNRVLGLSRDEQDIYGRLLLKESINSNTIPGVSFSGSYRAISGRLSALTTYRPERHRLAAIALVVFSVMVFSLAWFSTHPAGWLEYNQAYNQEFDVYLECYDSVSTETWNCLIEYLAEEEGRNWVGLDLVDESQFSPELLEITYEVVDGELQIDMLALQAVVQQFQGRYDTVEISAVSFSSMSYMMDFSFAGQDMGGQGRIAEYTVDIQEIYKATEQNRYSYQPLVKRDLYEFMIKIMAHWA